MSSCVPRHRGDKPPYCLKSQQLPASSSSNTGCCIKTDYWVCWWCKFCDVLRDTRITDCREYIYIKCWISIRAIVLVCCWLQQISKYLFEWTDISCLLTCGLWNFNFHDGLIFWKHPALTNLMTMTPCSLQQRKVWVQRHRTAVYHLVHIETVPGLG